MTPETRWGPERVPAELRSKLVATFNSGFKLSDSGGGFAMSGHTYLPVERDIATFVRYKNGRVNIVKWTGPGTAGPDVSFARQNLPLIVNGGKPNPNLNDGPEWGATLGNAALVWRSAVGIDARGNLIYVAGPDQGLHSLATTMIHAGAVRAMELDINTYWTSLITYRYPGARHPENLLAGHLPGHLGMVFAHVCLDGRDELVVGLPAHALSAWAIDYFCHFTLPRL